MRQTRACPLAPLTGCYDACAVYSSQLEWLPNGSELLDETRTVFGGSQEASPHSITTDCAQLSREVLLVSKCFPCCVVI